MKLCALPFVLLFAVAAADDNATTVFSPGLAGIAC